MNTDGRTDGDGIRDENLANRPVDVSAWWEDGFARSSCDRVRRRCTGSARYRLDAREAWMSHRSWHIHDPLITPNSHRCLRLVVHKNSESTSQKVQKLRNN